MSDCLKPTTVKTYPVQMPAPPGTCDLLPEWKDCGTCGGDFDGYDVNDGPVTYCVNGTMMIGQSLTTEPNKDTPFVGSFQVSPPTWSIMTLSQWMASKQDALVGSDGSDLAAGACVPTCSELDAVKQAADAAQGQLVGSDGSDLAAGACVPTCAELDAVKQVVDAAQGQLVGSDASALAAGDCVLTCASLSGDFTIDPATGEVGVQFPTSSDDVVTGGSVSGTDLILTTASGGSITIGGLPSGGGADDVVTGGSVSGTDLILTTASGGSITIGGLPSGGGGGTADGTVSSAALGADNVLTIASTVGADVTVDLSALAGGGGVTALSGCIENAVIDCFGDTYTNSILYANCHATDETSCSDGNNTLGPASSRFARIL